jgi:hypothetical protein
MFSETRCDEGDEECGHNREVEIGRDVDREVRVGELCSFVRDLGDDCVCGRDELVDPEPGADPREGCGYPGERVSP